MKEKIATNHEALAQINAILVKYNLPFKAVGFKNTVMDGSCGYDAMLKALAALHNHPFAGLIVEELRHVGAVLMRKDIHAQDQAFITCDFGLSVDEIVAQIEHNFGFFGWMNHINLAQFAIAMKTNILVFQFKGYVVVAKSNRLLLQAFDTCSVVCCSAQLAYHHYYAAEVAGEAPTERPTIVSVPLVARRAIETFETNLFVVVA